MKTSIKKEVSFDSENFTINTKRIKLDCGGIIYHIENCFAKVFVSAYGGKKVEIIFDYYVKRNDFDTLKSDLIARNIYFDIDILGIMKIYVDVDLICGFVPVIK